MGLIVLTLALWLPVEQLAKITSGIMLVNFTIVNASLVRLKLNRQELPEDVVQYPLVVPVLGCLLCILFLGVQIFALPA